jgi:hypothetical protein
MTDLAALRDDIHDAIDDEFVAWHPAVDYEVDRATRAVLAVLSSRGVVVLDREQVARLDEIVTKQERASAAARLLGERYYRVPTEVARELRALIAALTHQPAAEPPCCGAHVEPEPTWYDGACCENCPALRVQPAAEPVAYDGFGAPIYEDAGPLDDEERVRVYQPRNEISDRWDPR